MQSASPTVDPRRALAVSGSSGHPIATTEVLKIGSVKDAARANKRAAGLWHAYLRRGLPVPRHATKGGYRYTGMPPIASRIVIANGQLPTDSFHAGAS
jgi:hypothetical protein